LIIYFPLLFYIFNTDNTVVLFDIFTVENVS